MIPKILHFIWLGGNPLPPEIEECLNSWKEYFPDYEIKFWTEHDFGDIQVDYVAQAIKVKKWAFASDYIRLYVLYHYGGIYMDTDVLVRKNFDFVLNNRFFSAIESYPDNIEKSIYCGDIDEYGNRIKDIPFVYGIQVQAAIMGSEKGHPFVKDCMDYYDSHVFINEEGKLEMDMISPYIYANIAVKYGFKFINEEQRLSNGIVLYSASKFASSTCQVLPESYAVHCCRGSWRDSSTEKKHFPSEMIPSYPVVINRLNGIIRATKIMSKYDSWPNCNDMAMCKFFVYLSSYSLWQYRLFLLKLAFVCGIKQAKIVRTAVCFSRGVHTNWYRRMKQMFKMG